VLGIVEIEKLISSFGQTGDPLVHVCSSITALGGFAFLLLFFGVGVEFRKFGCVTFFRFVPWESIEGYEWKPSWSKDTLLLQIKLRQSPAGLQTTLHPAKKEKIDRILLEHLPQCAQPTGADALQAFDLASWSERKPAERMQVPVVMLGLSGLMQVLGAFPLMFWLVAVMGLPDSQPPHDQPDFMNLIILVAFLLLGLATMCVGLIVLNAARNMRKLKNYRACRVSAVLAMLPLGFGFLLGLPFGIWTLLVLRRADVRAAFARIVS